eukprot:5772942-Lingulodinium_polyedra.AAC.1
MCIRDRLSNLDKADIAGLSNKTEQCQHLLAWGLRAEPLQHLPELKMTPNMIMKWMTERHDQMQRPLSRLELREQKTIDWELHCGWFNFVVDDEAKLYGKVTKLMRWASQKIKQLPEQHYTEIRDIGHKVLIKSN